MLQKTESQSIKFVDLFCGMGGFHQALFDISKTTSIRFECVLSCDIDLKCRQVYESNWGIKCQSDIRKIKPEMIEDFDILCAGFPCQPFSNGGKKKSFDDERGLLFDEIIRIATVKKPKFMFLENVKHILRVSGGAVIKYIEKKIKNIGYHLYIFKISPHEWGIPQQRERVYFTCIRNDILIDRELKLPKYDGTLEFEKFLDKKENIDKKYFLKDMELDVLNAWDEMIKQFSVLEKISPTILINDAYRKYSIEEFNNFPKWRQDYITKNQPLLKKYKKEFREWYQKYGDLISKREIYGKLEWQCGLIQKDDSIFNHFIQIRQSGIRVKKSKYFPTLVAISQIPIYGKEKRYITPRECARLQSFPDDYKLSGDDRVCYKQLGNSVNVYNVYIVIMETLRTYNMV